MLTHVVFSLSPHVHSHAVSSHVLRKISPLLSRHRAAPELGWPPHRRHGRGSAVPRVVHFCTSLGTPRRWSLCLEGLYANGVLHISFGLASRDRALICSGSSCYRFGLRVAIPPKLCESRHMYRCFLLSRVICTRLSPQLSPLRAAVCLVVSGHLLTQTCLS